MESSNLSKDTSQVNRNIKLKLNFSHAESSSSENKNLSTSKEDILTDKHRIGFLNQCKLELSAEVIRWKEENHKLRKENEVAMKRIEELESSLTKLSRQSKELETTLFLSQEDNKRLKMRTLVIGEENSMLHEKLSKSRFHSYPWIELANRNLTHSYQEDPYVPNSVDAPSEGWEEVSRQLFRQMEQEIMEMQKFGHSLNSTRAMSAPASTAKALPSGEDSKRRDEVKSLDIDDASKVEGLLHEINVLKHHLKFQNEKLQFLINQNSKGNDSKSNLHSCDPKNAAVNPSKGTNSDLAGSSRPSDETFRAYFTRQLNSCKNNEEIKKISQPTKKQKQNPSECTAQRLHQQEGALSNQQYSNYPSSMKMPFEAETATLTSSSPDDDRVCPICEAMFPKVISDKDFEAHVIAHLEAVSASMLDQYEIV